MIFYLGTHQPHWLRLVDVPLFVSRGRLTRYKTLPRATCRWALDSGGFSELSLHGQWTIPPEQYVAEVRRFSAQIGGLDWAAIQDWMCEPQIRAKTRLAVEDHQRRTVRSLLLLRELAPEQPWAPVLQGWEHDDYYDHIRLYEAAGVDLAAEPVVGLGSVCRRQATEEIQALINTLVGHGLHLHGFGVKTGGLMRSADLLTSADSMAWSLHARKNPNTRLGEPGCRARHRHCGNCLPYALQWRADLLAKVAA